jgi:hypothetical protein
MKEIVALICKVDHPDDLKKAALRQPPLNSEGGAFWELDPEAIIEEIKHNESGLTGVYKNRQGACYRIGLSSGVDIAVPADSVRTVIAAETAKVGG